MEDITEKKQIFVFFMHHCVGIIRFGNLCTISRWFMVCWFVILFRNCQINM